jgi:ParB family chromosome partitioning protein
MEEKLGRGIAALFGDSSADTKKLEPTREVNIDVLVPNPNQPRRSFEDDKLGELASSIAFHGVLQPIVVRQRGDKYEIVAGERRWKAAKMSNLTTVPVHIIECTDGDLLALSLIENIQRDDLNPIDEASAIQKLIDDCACTQEELGAIIGKSRSHVGNMLRLLYLPQDIQDFVRSGALTVGHAKCLVGVEDAVEIAHMTVKRGMNVRQLENLIKTRKREVSKIGESGSSQTKLTKEISSAVYEASDISRRLTNALHLSAKLKITRDGGVLTLTCKSCEELEDLIEKLVSLDKQNEIS